MCETMVSGQIFMISLWVGIGSIAVWAYLRFTRVRPSGLRLAMAHVVGSFALLLTAPFMVHTAMVTFPSPFSVVFAVACVTVPLGSYVFLSWIWLLARIHESLGTPPRGGLPAETEA